MPLYNPITNSDLPVILGAGKYALKTIESGITTLLSAGEINISKTFVSDTFSRADSSTSLGSAETGQVYTAHVGTWGVISNTAYNASGTVDGRATLDSGIIDGIFTCSLYSDNYGPTNARVPNFIFRGQDAGNYLNVALYNNYVLLIKRDVGTNTGLSQAVMTLVNGQIYTVKVIASGTNIKVFVDDVQKIDYTLAGNDVAKYTASNCTRVGFRTGGTTSLNNVRFDNLKVEVA